ncbi:unknown [Clostridium sp. CAG:306]|jgi:hypothetical protein|nr:unknown [Clostridium sp. CAG:306]
MSFVAKIYANITKSKLSDLAKKSVERIKSVEEENVFHSKTLEELFTEKYDYKGSEPDLIYVKNLLTNEPEAVRVKIEIKPNKKFTFFQELYMLFDNNGTKIGQKDFSYRRMPDGKYVMYSGEMDNFSKIYGGVGIRLDQMHIERAMQLGVDSIPREALPKATLYHTKMGFLPIEKKLVQLKSINQVKNFTEAEFCYKAKSIPLHEFEPVIVQKGTKFYIDVNKTQTLTNLKMCKQQIEKTGFRRILHLDSTYANLTLSGQELLRWKEIIKGHEILPKLSFILPKF